MDAVGRFGGVVEAHCLFSE